MSVIKILIQFIVIHDCKIQLKLKIRIENMEGVIIAVIVVTVVTLVITFTCFFICVFIKARALQSINTNGGVLSRKNFEFIVYIMFFLLINVFCHCVCL